MNHLYSRVRGCDFLQPSVFERDADGEIDAGFRKIGHLSESGFTRGGAGPGLHHDLDIHQFFANLLHKIFLGNNADEHRQPFGRKTASRNC